MAEFYEESAARLAVHLEAGRTVVRARRGRPAVLRVVHVHARPARRPVRDRGRAGGDVVRRRDRGRRVAARAPDRRAHGPARHPRRARARPAPRRHRRRDHHEARPHVPRGRLGAARRPAGSTARCTSSAPRCRRSAGCRSPTSTRDTVPYFSLIVVPGDTSTRSRGRRSPTEPPWLRRRARAAVSNRTAAAELLVVGLGPGPDRWITPEVTAALAEVDHVVGYAPYVNRVPQREGLTRHASGNTVEVDRARLALDLALKGERVAVVSGGDAGVFGMAAAVFEAAEDEAYADVPIRVLPGRLRRAGRGGPRGCADRRRLRGDEPVRPAQAVVADREAAARRRRGRPRARRSTTPRPAPARRRSPTPSRSCSSTAPATPSWSSAATSAATRSR